MKRLFPLALIALVIAGCGGNEQPTLKGPTLVFTTDVMKAVADKTGPGPLYPAPGDENTPADYPTFKFAPSEYPPWCTFGVADRRGLIKKERGKVGPLERKWGVDIEVVYKDYDACITGYGTKEYDAICVTNVDILAPSLGRPAIAYCPTSFSDGADGLAGLGYTEPSDPNLKAKSVADFLKGKKTRGLDVGVSRYVFDRSLEKLGLNPDDFEYAGMDPAQAATGLQQGQDGFESAMLWNPFLRQSLKTFNPQKPAPGIVLNSHLIPREVIDMLVVGKDVYEKKGGKEFSALTVDIYYSVNRLLEDPKIRESVLTDLGKNFSNLDAKEMALCLQDSHLFATVADGIEEYTDPKLKTVMDQVVGFAKRRKMLVGGSDPVISYAK